MATQPEIRPSRLPPLEFPPQASTLTPQASKEWGMLAASHLSAGLNTVFGSRAENAFGILTYHRVAPRSPGVSPPLHNVTPDRFKEQLTGLVRRGHGFWPLRTILDHLRAGRKLPDRTVAVTFDDGFQTVHSRALPVLRDLAIPATIFVNTAYLDSDEPFPFDAWGVAFRGRVPSERYLPLTTAECHKLQASGLIELGAHTHTHQDFRGCPELLRRDLQVSVDILRSEFGVDDATFAFPFGSPQLGFAGGDLTCAAKQTGVTCSLTTEPVLNHQASDPFQWGRFNAFSWDNSATLAAKLAGWYSWAPRLWQRLSSRRPA